jgi:hypothetical protein
MYIYKSECSYISISVLVWHKIKGAIVLPRRRTKQSVASHTPYTCRDKDSHGWPLPNTSCLHRWIGAASSPETDVCPTHASERPASDDRTYVVARLRWNCGMQTRQCAELELLLSHAWKIQCASVRVASSTSSQTGGANISECELALTWTGKCWRFCNSATRDSPIGGRDVLEKKFRPFLPWKMSKIETTRLHGDIHTCIQK